MEISKEDWKLFRTRLAQWQEHHMENLVEEYRQLLNEDILASDRFWKLDERIRKDRKHPGVIFEVRRSNMLPCILTLLADGIITDSDLEGFSQELLDAIHFIKSRW